MEFLVAIRRHLPDIVALTLFALIQVQFTRWTLSASRQGWPAAGRIIRLGITAITIWVFGTIFVSMPPVSHLLPSSWWLSWSRGVALAWIFASSCTYLIVLAWRWLRGLHPSEPNQERRGFLKTAGAAVAAMPFAAMGFGVLVQREDFRIREIEIPVRGLPKDLQGLRLIQISDIHLSPFLTETELARTVDMANEQRAHIALVTGDLITSRGDPVDACVRQLARLRADAGVFGCLGNHEIYAGVQNHVTREGARLGIRFLRQQAERLRFGGSELNLVGVDYQKMGGSYLTGAERWVVPGTTNLLLSHNPDVFDVAAGQGWDVTLSGHTHGGQVNFEILNQSINIARFYTPYVYGLYRQGDSSIYVTRGIGTVGLPARLGAPPEVVLIRLCAI
jgi:uncharacterized protein